jgi:hypothetical protein
MIRPFLSLAAALAVTGAAAQAVPRQTVDVIGGSRPPDPAWSPQRGYYGGGPADQQYAREQEQARQAAASRGVQAPALLSNCNAGGCWDNQGNRYNNTGDGTRFLNKDGRLCTASGKFITCN